MGNHFGSGIAFSLIVQMLDEVYVQHAVSLVQDDSANWTGGPAVPLPGTGRSYYLINILKNSFISLDGRSGQIP